MLLPWAVSTLGGVMLAGFVGIPASPELDLFAKVLESRQLLWKILGVVLSYFVLWGIFLLYQKRRKRNLKKWLISCIPDYLYVPVVVTAPIYGLITGDNLFTVLDGIADGVGLDFNVFLFPKDYLLPI